MTHAAPGYPTLAQTLSPHHSLIRNVLLVASGAALVALAAQIEIPMQPVPLTLQTLAVLLVGAVLGSKRGAAALALYLAAGAAGLPVLSGGGAGLAKIMGPTGGYLLGFILAAGVVGWLAERYALDRKFAGTALAMLVGNVVIYIPGLLWLANVLHVSASKAVEYGLTPFLIGDGIKLLLAALLLPAAWAFVGRQSD
ncbi:MAG: hypothetical protein JWQ08_54 [Deinococcus sp.]|nr:hypothetical protein [Deinococcus sp.]